MTEKIAAGTTMPKLDWPLVGGGRAGVGGGGKWQMLVVYRGKHCPLCKKYFATLGELKDDIAKSGLDLLTVSADPEEKAKADVAEQGWKFPVAYGLSIEQMKKLGLYISEPRSPQETDRPFAEPGVFVVNPEGKVQVVDISNAPFSRPDLRNLLTGINFVREKNYPVRGTMA